MTPPSEKSLMRPTMHLRWGQYQQSHLVFPTRQLEQWWEEPTADVADAIGRFFAGKIQDAPRGEWRPLPFGPVNAPMHLFDPADAATGTPGGENAKGKA